MKTDTANVNPHVEPVLFPGGALSITVEALLDPHDCTVVFVVRAYDVGSDKLIALWSSSPQGFDDYERYHKQALQEFSKLLHEHSGPF